jgi:molecular chaperone IbpA
MRSRILSLAYIGGLNMTFLTFPSFNTTTVGFEETFKKLQDLANTTLKSVGYPPYNIVKTDENKYLIEMAVAGFGKQNIELELHEGKLTVKGNLDSDDKLAGSFLYKGISDRAFTRTFTLADTVEIQGAELVNGMLKVFLENVIPESNKPKKINIAEKE